MSNGDLRTRVWLVIVSICAGLAGARGVAAPSFTINTGDDLQAALDAAHCGDTIVLQAGVTYRRSSDTANFMLRNHGVCTGTDADYITVTTSNLSGISAPGTRIEPSIHAAAMPKIVIGQYALQTEAYAHHYKFVGIEFTSIGDPSIFIPVLIQIGTNASRAERLGQHHYIFDRCFLHPAEISASNLANNPPYRTNGRGIDSEAAYTTIKESYVAGYAGYYPNTATSIDSYGVYSTKGAGPITITNNYIEANFNNIFLGGTDPDTPNFGTYTSATVSSATLSTVANLSVGDLIAFPLTNPPQEDQWGTVQVQGINGLAVTYVGVGPSALVTAPAVGGTARWNGDTISNVLIQDNLLVKRPEWVVFGAQPKAFIEIKTGHAITINRNRMVSTFPTATLAATVRNQAGSSPWVKITNLSFTNNHVSGWSAAGVSVLTDGQRTSDVSHDWLIQNNLFDQIGSPNHNYVLLTAGDKWRSGYNITVSHNTFIGPGQSNLLSGVGATNGFVFKDNIGWNGLYAGQFCEGAPDCWPSWVVSRNVIVNDTGATPNWPAGNFIVSSLTAVGFADAGNLNYRLLTSSPYHNAASDGTDIGVNMDALRTESPAPPTNVRIIK